MACTSIRAIRCTPMTNRRIHDNKHFVFVSEHVVFPCRCDAERALVKSGSEGACISFYIYMRLSLFFRILFNSRVNFNSISVLLFYILCMCVCMFS